MKVLDKKELLKEVREEIKKYPLKEACEGIFSLGEFDNSGDLVIALHPYFACEYEVDEEINCPLNYHENMETFLANYNGPVITLEDTENLGKTLNKFFKRENKGSRIIIPTPPHYPDPLIGWGSFINFVNTFKKDKKLIGGYLHCSYSTPGCLGRTAQIFKKSGINFEFKLDLIYPVYPNGSEEQIKELLFTNLNRIKLEERIVSL